MGDTHVGRSHRKGLPPGSSQLRDSSPLASVPPASPGALITSAPSSQAPSHSPSQATGFSAAQHLLLHLGLQAGEGAPEIELRARGDAGMSAS